MQYNPRDRRNVGSKDRNLRGRGLQPTMSTKNTMIDTTDPITLANKLDVVVADGITAAGFYLFEQSNYKKKMTNANVKFLSKKLYLVSIWENGNPTHASYFSGNRGNADANSILHEASLIGVPKNTIIYPTVDFDATSADIPVIEKYFEYLNSMLKDHFQIGAYGSGYILKYLKTKGLATKTWLAGSTGWAGYEDWNPRADIVQTRLDISYHGMQVDINYTNGNAGGWKLT